MMTLAAPASGAAEGGEHSGSRAEARRIAICATPEQAGRVAAFYRERPGTMPIMAARGLGLSPAVVSSALPAARAASATRDAFADVWAAMSRWRQANFLILKGPHVFEILSGVSEGSPSTRSRFYNIKYDHALRGHLRPDLLSGIYAIDLPAESGEHIRGVMFFDDAGELAFGAFMSGESLHPEAEEIEKFEAVMALVRSATPACPGG